MQYEYTSQLAAKSLLIGWGESTQGNQHNFTTTTSSTAAAATAGATTPAGTTALVRYQPCNCALVGAREHPTGTQRTYSTLHVAGHASHIVHIVPGCARVSLYGR